MGSSHPKQGQVQGNMYISLDSNSVESGGVLSGSVHIALTEQLTNPKLYLIFKGNEITDFKTEHEDKNNKKYYERHTGKQPLCVLKAILYQWPDLVAFPGNLTIPFELKVYDCLLPSFHTWSYWGGFCEINYSIRAQLHAADRLPRKYKAPVSVFTKSLTLPQEMYPQSLSRDCPGHGSLLCCFKKEYAASKVWIERGTFGKLDNICINLDTDLSGFSANVTKVRIEIHKVLKMIANKYNWEKVTQAAIVYSADKTPEIKAFSGPQHFEFIIPIESILLSEHCYSLSAQLIKCHFVINVKLHTDRYCWKCYGFDKSKQGIVLLPFKIEAPIIPPPIEPEQWQAQILPESSIDPEIQDPNNPNPLIVKSFKRQPGSDYKIVPDS